MTKIRLGETLNILYISNSTEDFHLEVDDQVFSYQLGIGKPVGPDINILNDSNLLNKVALDLRDDYCDFINSINRNFLDNDIVLDNKISLFFLTDCSNKRTENFTTYASICHLHVILLQLKKIQIDKIIFNHCCDAFIESALSIIKIKNHQVIGQYKINPSLIFLKQARFFTRVLYSIFLMSLYGHKRDKINSKIHSLYLTRYPLHFENAAEDTIYGDLDQTNSSYLVSIITDGIHQSFSGRKLIRRIKELESLKSRSILLDSYLTTADVFKAFLDHLHLDYFLNSKIKKEDFIFKDIVINKYIFHELSYSFLRLARLLMYRKSIDRVLKEIKPKELHYYLFEFSYGRLFSALLGSFYPKINTIGYQHGPISKRKLLFFLSKNEIDRSYFNYLDHVPVPELIKIEDQFSIELYKEAGYDNLTLMSKVPRLSALKSINREKIEEKSILIVCGSNDSLFIFNYLKSEIEETSEKKYFFKLHPRGDNRSVLKAINNFTPDNFKIADKDLLHYFNFVSEVYVTYSSAGVEAMNLNIPIRLIDLPNVIQESPIKDFIENTKA